MRTNTQLHSHIYPCSHTHKHIHPHTQTCTESISSPSSLVTSHQTALEANNLVDCLQMHPSKERRHLTREPDREPVIPCWQSMSAPVGSGQPLTPVHPEQRLLVPSLGTQSPPPPSGLQGWTPLPDSGPASHQFLSSGQQRSVGPLWPLHCWWKFPGHARYASAERQLCTAPGLQKGFT